MTDHDRGAYTPQPDAPLQFDARGPRARRPMPMTLIGSGAVLVVLLGALALHYRADTKPETPRPVGEPIAQVKAPAPVTAQPHDPAAAAPVAGVDVFGGSGKGIAKAPNFAPPPEAPKPRAQLTVQAVEGTAVKPVQPLSTTATVSAAQATTNKVPTNKAPTIAAAPPYKAPTATAVAKPDATSVIEKLAAIGPTRAAAATVTTRPVATASTGAAAPDKPIATAPATVAPKAVSVAKAVTASKPASIAKPAVAVSGTAAVQIGAFSSTSQSDKGWSEVSAAMGADMSGKSKRVEIVSKDGKTYYRTLVTGFASRAGAEAFCETLKGKSKTCIVKS